MSNIEQIPQRNQEWLTSATADDITRAHAAGELAELLGAPIPVRLLDSTEQITAEELRQLTEEQISKARDAGRLSGVLTGSQMPDGG